MLKLASVINSLVARGSPAAIVYGKGQSQFHQGITNCLCFPKFYINPETLYQQNHFINENNEGCPVANRPMFPADCLQFPFVALNMMTMLYSESKANNKAANMCCAIAKNPFPNSMPKP